MTKTVWPVREMKRQSKRERFNLVVTKGGMDKTSRVSGSNSGLDFMFATVVFLLLGFARDNSYVWLGVSIIT